MLLVDSPGNSHKVYFSTVVMESVFTYLFVKVLITKYGEVADGEYLDPKGKQVIINH
jgi:capping protein alpha